MYPTPLRFADRSFASDADRTVCRAMIREGSKSFAAAALLLPPRLREPAYALYAFCRLSDDMVDIEGGAMEAIARLRQRLDLAYAGQPMDSSVDRAFADAVTRHAIPRALPEALIDGLEWDVRGFPCEDLSDVYAYAARVAGAVGAMMCCLMGERDAVMAARACDLGIAMQLTNIARDAGEDAYNGRLYLPRAWLRAEGIDPDGWLTRPVFDQRIANVVARLLDAADALYAQADSGIANLPAACRPAIFAARYLYHAIGCDVRAHKCDSISSRARVSGLRKAGLVARALCDAVIPRAVAKAPALPESQFLVNAVAQSQPVREMRGVTGRILWVAELFASLDARSHSVRA